MDPVGCLREWLSCTDRYRKSELKVALNGWLYKCGYPPRVALHPATDLWMMGARYGTVVCVGRKYVQVRLDATGRVHKLAPTTIMEVYS